MDKPLATALVWFRRDLRADDHAALYHALKAARQVWCVFVFDDDILAPLPRADRRVEFIRESVVELSASLEALAARHGTRAARLIVTQGAGTAELVRIADALHVQAVYANHDDEPDALERDAKVRGALADMGIALHTSKDHVVFERNEVLSASGTPYGVYTPYMNAWLKRLDPFFLQAYPVERYAESLAPLPPAFDGRIPALKELGFEATNLQVLPVPTGSSGAHALLADFLQRIDHYDAARNFPAIKGPSYLSVHLRFGTISIRELARRAVERIEAVPKPAGRGAEVWLSELIWRDFYQQVLHHRPDVVTQSYKPAYDKVRFEHGKAADALFAAWCEGRTGYPLIDAAMAQINQTGWMHNRLRMVSASFLVKDLGIDWRRGERFFAEKLIDYDLAANNGGWQWAASTGTDAQPWFRIFNPITQSEKFDAGGRFIRRYLPQLAGLADDVIHAPWLARPLDLASANIELGRDYPLPIVDHDEARKRTLARYAVVKGAAGFSV
ncbi:MAG: DNA photolyase family protein [Pseudomonadota bacterium]|nr:DNA photolyase family protein [Pseudomonadota bacterium]